MTPARRHRRGRTVGRSGLRPPKGSHDEPHHTSFCADCCVHLPTPEYPMRLSPLLLGVVVALEAALLVVPAPAADDEPKKERPVGIQGPVGCKENPKKVDRLEITKSGVYENYLV